MLRNSKAKPKRDSGKADAGTPDPLQKLPDEQLLKKTIDLISLIRQRIIPHLDVCEKSTPVAQETSTLRERTIFAAGAVAAIFNKCETGFAKFNEGSAPAATTVAACFLCHSPCRNCKAIETTESRSSSSSPDARQSVRRGRSRFNDDRRSSYTTESDGD